MYFVLKLDTWLTPWLMTRACDHCTRFASKHWRSKRVATCFIYLILYFSAHPRICLADEKRITETRYTQQIPETWKAFKYNTKVSSVTTHIHYLQWWRAKWASLFGHILRKQTSNENDILFIEVLIRTGERRRPHLSLLEGEMLGATIYQSDITHLLRE